MTDDDSSLAAIIGWVFGVGVAVGATGYICYQIGHANGYKEGYPDGLEDCKVEFDDLKVKYQQLRRQVKEDKDKYRELKKKDDLLLAWARKKGYIPLQCNNEVQLEIAHKKVDEEILQLESQRAVLCGQPARGVLSAANFVRDRPIVSFGTIGLPYPYAKVELAAELKMPKIDFDFERDPVKPGACVEVKAYLEEIGVGLTDDGEINIQRVIDCVITKLHNKTFDWEVDMEREPDIVPPGVGYEIEHGDVVGYKCFAHCDLFNQELQKGVAQIAQEVRKRYNRVLKEKGKDDAWLAYNKNKLLKIALLELPKGARDGYLYWSTTDSVGYRFATTDFEIVQDGLRCYTPMFENGRGPVVGAANVLWGWKYYCKIVKVDEENLRVYLRSETLEEHMDRYPKLRHIRELMAESRNVVVDRFSDERVLERIYKRLSIATGGGIEYVCPLDARGRPVRVISVKC